MPPLLALFYAARFGAVAALWVGATNAAFGQTGAPPSAAVSYHQNIEPLLAKYCYDCHGNGVNKGGLTLDTFASDTEMLRQRHVWLAALKNVRAGLMPPHEEDVACPTDAEISTLAHWIKYGAFGLVPDDPDPGHVTPRRLNRVEYRNTIRDLMGCDFNSEVEFPPDDSGNGFDNNGDVLTLSPLLLEKYLAAAETIVGRAVPKVAKVVRGPLSPQHGTTPENYARFFPAGPAPDEDAARDRYAADLLRKFATQAFRRPIEEARVGQLVALARQVYAEPGRTFEEGIGRAMMAVLASPRFLFRVESPEKTTTAGRHALLDEYTLASRLSYFLWSSMPDDELFRLAARGELRRNLRPQVTRLLNDARAQAFVRNFTGQWLQARDVEFVPINARVALGAAARPNRDGRIEFDGAFRRLLRSETEMYFEHVIRTDRSVLDLVDSDYAFLNERLAAHYGVPGVMGQNLRFVQLPPDSPRGGVLTQGTVLAVTSNPTRTSPVKRGLFILENILGIPPPPPPPNVPDLEESKKEFKGREPKLSEMLAVHRANKLCHSCHARMDPLGLALENFNALGGWRETEAGQPIDPAGVLITGEKFANVRELKRVLARDRKADIYRCLTEKIFTYALGRAVEYYDAPTIDEITGRLLREEGRMSVLLMGVIESAAFQKQRISPQAGTVGVDLLRSDSSLVADR